MELLSINLGTRREIETGKPQPEATGIFKTPVDGPVMVGELGLKGDFIASSIHHGGPDQAVYMMDDGDGPNFICCPLPAADILTDDPPQVRGTTCATDEVITGAAGRYSYRCSRINTERYQLAAAERPCYFGSGAAGGGGVSGCAGHPHTWSVLADWLFGSDGCSGHPYGSLFVAMTGDDCRDLAASQLLYTGAVEGDPAGAPVPMFED